jgi:hypothetical protein
MTIDISGKAAAGFALRAALLGFAMWVAYRVGQYDGNQIGFKAGQKACIEALRWPAKDVVHRGNAQKF